MLWSTGQLGAPKEYLNPTQRRDWSIRRGHRRYRPLRGPLRGLLNHVPLSDAALRDHLHYIRDRRSSNGWFGLKVHAHHHRAFFCGRPLSDVLGPVRWIRIHRADRLGQAISWARALQTGRWAAGERGWLPPVYSRRLVDRCLRAIDDGERYWDAFFSARPVLRVEYSALSAAPESVVGGVLGELGVSAVLGAPGLTRQADAVSAVWRARYLSG